MNSLTHVLHTQIELHVNDRGDYMVFPDEADERILTAQEIILLAELSGVFEPVAWYGDYKLDQPLDTSPASPRMIAVLQKID